MSSSVMSAVQKEITVLEDQLRLAEMGPDPDFFERVLADDCVMVSDGKPGFAKRQVVEAHRAGKAPKFSRVEMSDVSITDHGSVAVVTCKGTYESSGAGVSLRFMRVWMKKNNSWRIVAGSISPDTPG